MANLGIRIKDLRRERHMTQIELADMINVSQQTLSAYEGNRILPPLDVFMKLCRVLRVTPNELTGVAKPKPAVFTYDEEKLIEAYREADPDARAVVRFALKNFLQKEKPARHTKSLA